MAQVSREEAARRALHEEILRTAGSRRGPAGVRVTVEDTEAGRVTRVESTEPRHTIRKEKR